jgi:hypothetical protein
MCVDGFYNFCFFVDEKIKLKVLACFLKLLTIFKNSSNNPIRRPSNSDFDYENAFIMPPLILLNHTGNRR